MPKSTFYEGQTATNPTTGERIVYRGGKWSPFGANANLAGNLNAREEKELTDIRTAASNSRMATDNANRFMEVNARQDTGGLLAIPGFSEVRGWFDPEVSTMQGFSNAMVPGMHVTPGPMTDADAKQYKSAIPNPDKPFQTNLNQTRRIRGQETYLSAKEAFLERFAQRTGTLNGANAAFEKFWAGYSKTLPPAAGGPPANAPRKANAGWSIERAD